MRLYFTTYLPALFIAAILTPATVAVIAFYDWQSAVIVLIALPLIPIFMVLIGLTTADRSAAALRAMATLQSRLLDLVAGLPTLRALRRVGGSATRIAELGAAHRRSTMATLRIAFLSSLVLELLATLGVALVAVSVGLRLVYGDVTLTAGLTALLLAPEVFWPLRRVGMAFHAAQDGKAAADNAFRLVDALPRPVDGTQTVAAAGATIDITAFNAAVEPGRVTVIAGPNGAGKTTLLQAILGLNEPTSGRIRVDGVDVADLDLRAWWAQVAWLAQRPDAPPRHGAAESRTVRSAGRRRRGLPCRMFRRGTGRPAGRSAHGAGQRWGRPVARSAAATRAGPGAGIARLRCCCSTSRQLTWMPRRNAACFMRSLRARQPARR